LLSAFAKPPDLGLLTKLLALLAGLSFCELLCCGSDSLSSGYVSLGSDRPKIKTLCPLLSRHPDLAEGEADARRAR
jgi:hypothetical protein